MEEFNKLIEMLDLNTDEIRTSIIESLSEKIADDVRHEIKQSIVNSTQTKVDEYISGIVEEVSAQSFQPTNGWGEPIGEPTTIKNMIWETVQSWWESKVDRSGKRCNGYESTTRAEYYSRRLVGEYVDINLRKEMEAIIDEGRGKVREAMSKSIKKQLEKLW